MKRQTTHIINEQLYSWLFIIMLVGLFFSRAILSISQVIWAIGYIYILIRQGKKDSPFHYWSGGVLLIALLGCWQSPFQWNHFDYLLTLLMYPIAFHVCNRMPANVLQKWIMYCCVAAGVGIAYALFAYAQASGNWWLAYGAGKSLPTFMDTDHVRFGIFLCGTGMLVTLLHKISASLRWGIIALLVISIAFMAVRTAWVASVIIILTYVAMGLLAQQRRSRIILFLGVVIAVVIFSVGAFKLFPTVQQKWAYTQYDWQQYAGDSSTLAYSDGARRTINTLVWNEITNNKQANKGWAGIAPTLQASFKKTFPNTPVSFTWPFNQWLFWWMGAGLAGMVLCTIWLFFPLWLGWQKKQWTIVAWTLAIAASCMVESTLSLQYGIWLHAWIGAIAWNLQNQTSLQANLNE
jgi:hypothetical protein